MFVVNFSLVILFSLIASIHGAWLGRYGLGGGFLGTSAGPVPQSPLAAQWRAPVPGAGLDGVPNLVVTENGVIVTHTFVPQPQPVVHTRALTQSRAISCGGRCSRSPTRRPLHP